MFGLDSKISAFDIFWAVSVNIFSIFCESIVQMGRCTCGATFQLRLTPYTHRVARLGRRQLSAMSTYWPDDAVNNKKPRYSAETGTQLLVKKNLDLENTKNELFKLKERLDTITREREELANKLAEETTRSTSLEDQLFHRKEELAQEKLSRINLEAEVEAAHQKCKAVELEQRRLEEQLADLGSQQDSVASRNRIAALEKRVQALQLENARLASGPERPPSRTSAIPVATKSRHPRSSSEVRTTQLEDDLAARRAELVEEKAKVKKLEARVRKAEQDAIQLQNEKIADARKAKSRVEELGTALAEAKEEIELLKQAQPSVNQSDDVEIGALKRRQASLEDQLRSTVADKADLERRLARKTSQCQTLQEKLDEYMLPSANEEALRQEVASLKQELATIRRETNGGPNRRESLTQIRYDLQDRERQVAMLQEKLRRRESSTADLAAQEEKMMRLLNEKENVKDDLAKAKSQIRYLESQLSFKQQELKLAQAQVQEFEVALNKARSLNAQHQELYSQVVQSCTEAEKRADDVERELIELREEYANRSTLEEAQERNAQWARALDRVAELENRLAAKNDGTSTPRASRASLPPVLSFADESEMDSVARLVVGLQRIREERDTLRGSVEFLNFELRAKETTYSQRLAAEQSRLLALLQRAEQDAVVLRGELSEMENRLKVQPPPTDPPNTVTEQARRTRMVATAAFVSLQRAHLLLESETEQSALASQQLEAGRAQLQSALDKVTELTSLLGVKDHSLEESNQRSLELSRDLRDKSLAIRDLEDKLRTLEQSREKLQNLFEEQTGTLKNLEREHNAQTMHLQRLEEAHQIAREELYEARVEADQLRNEHLHDMAREDPEAQAALQRHIEELDARIVRRNEQIGTHQNEIRRLDMNLRIAENAVDEMRSELEELRSQRVWLESDAETVREERNHAQKELEATRTELDALRADLEEQQALLRTSSFERQTEVATLVQIIASFRLRERLASQNTPTQPPPSNLDESSARDISQVVDPHLERNEELERLLHEATLRGDVLAQQLQRTTELAKQDVAERLSTLEEEVECLTAEVESLEQRLCESQQECIEEQRKLVEASEQNEVLLGKISQLENEVTAVTREHEEKMDSLLAQLAEADQSHEQLEHQRLALATELDDLQSKYSSAIASAIGMEKISAEVQQLEMEKAQLEERIESVTSQLEDQRAENSKSALQLQELEQVRSSLRSKQEELDAVRVAQRELSQTNFCLQGEKAAAQRRADENEILLARLEKDIAEAQKQACAFSQLQSELASLQQAHAKMEVELYEAQQAASAAASTTVRDAEASAKVIELEETITRLKEENEELERVLTIKTKEIDEYDDRHIEILKERKKLVTKIDSLTRKMRTMQRQLDSHAPGSMDSVPISESVASSLAAPPSYFAPSHLPTSSAPTLMQTPAQSHTPLEPVNSKSSVQLKAVPSAQLPSVPSSGSRRVTTPSVPHPIDTAVAASSPNTLSSSAPPVSATPSSALGFFPVSASAPAMQPAPSHTSTTGTPPPVALPSSQSSSTRKRRMPEDFDPKPEDSYPPMPVLSTTTPARLRKVLREGPLPRTGFTPSRSRKNSAVAAIDQELANAAAAAAASLKLTEALQDASNMQPKRAASRERAALLPQSSAKSEVSNASHRTGSSVVSDITNAPRPMRSLPSSMATTSLSSAKSSTTTSAPKLRTGWFNHSGKTSSASSGTGHTNTTTRRTTRVALDTSPKLGSGVMPRRLYVPPTFSKDLA